MTKKQHILLLIPILLFAIITIYLFLSPSINHGRVYNNDILIRQEASGSRLGSFVGHSDGHFSIGNFSGIRDLYFLTVETEKEIWEYSCDINLENGLFKIVLVTEDGEVITLAENDSDISQTIELPQGKHRIKIVGKNAKVDFAFSPTSSTDTIKIEYRH